MPLQQFNYQGTRLAAEMTNVAARQPRVHYGGPWGEVGDVGYRRLAVGAVLHNI